MITERKNDEIDLIVVFQKVGVGLKNLFNWFLNLLYKILLFFIRKIILTSIIIILLLAFGYYKYKTSPRYYSSSIEAYSNAISSIDMINYVNNIYELFRTNNIGELQTKLNIEQEELEKIKNVKAYKVIDLNKDGVTDEIDYYEKYSTADTLVSESRFVVKVEVFDPAIFPIIQASILSYIDKNKYINELNTIRKKQLNELIVKLDEEISALDSLKKTEYFKIHEKLEPQGGQLLVLNEKETKLYHDQIISLYKQKQDLEQNLELRTEPITIIQDFSALTTVENNLMSYMRLFGLIGFAIGILLSFIIEKRKGIIKIISDSRNK